VAPDPATGRRRQRTKGGFPTKKAAEEAMRVAIAKGSSAGAGAQKLGDYLDEHLKAVEPRRRETTATDRQIGARRIRCSPTPLRRAFAGYVVVRPRLAASRG